jgi:hypothetical protein
MAHVFKLTARDFTDVGGPMGSSQGEGVYFEKLFAAPAKAMAHAEKHYKKNETGAKKLEWSRDGKNRWTTGDLRWVCYDITKETIS